MSDQTEEAAPDVVVESPAESTAEAPETVLETVTETTASPEQTETTDATGGESQGEASAGAPETYEAFNAPEGVEIPQDSAVVAAYSDFAKSQNLTQEQAQEGFAKLAQAQADQARAQQDAWRQGLEDETRNDPVLGGENLSESMVKADQVLATFDKDRKFTALLNETGLKWSKPIVALLNEVRDAIGEDRFLAGQPGEKPQERTAQDFYSKSNMNP